MIKIASIVGARPQFIKMSPVSKELRKKFNEIIIHTGQHYDKEMSKLFFEDLNIPKPDYNLSIGSFSHGKQTGKMLEKIEEVLLKEKPEIVIVFGDTNSTLAGALAASKLHIKVGHIEAGLRSFNRKMPEEINRIVADHISDILFTPTVTGLINLKNEGIINNVYNVGDVMYDALLNNIKIIDKKSNILKTLRIKKKNYNLMTVHRGENTDYKNNLKNIMRGVAESEEITVFPIHPRTKKYMKKYELYRYLKGKKSIILTEPLGYIDFIKLITNAQKIITDSGGLQKEAYLLNIPCITLRNETEWVETVEAGWNCLVGSNKKNILKAIENFNPCGEKKNSYGDGNASRKIRKILETQIFHTEI